VYLDGVPARGAAQPLAALALLLAGSLEEAPEYARARLAHELRDVLTELEALRAEADRENEFAARREQRARSRAWVADG
jgi:hypothetical protein